MRGSRCFLKTTLACLLLVVYFQSSTFAANEEKRSRVSIAKPVFDFGTVSQGTKVKHDFVIRNTGNADLLVQRVVASCGCTATNADPNVIPPNGEGIIKVEFDTTGFSGSKHKTVRVFTNDIDSSTTVLSLKGVVETDVTVTPRRVDFKEIVKDSSKSYVKDVLIKTRSGSGIKITKLRSFSKYLDVSKQDLSDGESRIRVTVKPDAPIGELRDKVIIGLKGARYKSLNIPIFASIKGVLRVSPQTVSFGVVEGGDKLRRSVKLDNLGSEKIDVLSVGSSHPGLSGNIKVTKPGKKFLVQIELDPTLVKKDLRAALEIKTSLATQPSLSVNVYGIAP